MSISCIHIYKYVYIYTYIDIVLYIHISYLVLLDSGSSRYLYIQIYKSVHIYTCAYIELCVYTCPILYCLTVAHLALAAVCRASTYQYPPWLYHVTHVNASCHTCKCVASHLSMHHTMFVNASRHTRKRAMWVHHVWMRHFTRFNLQVHRRAGSTHRCIFLDKYIHTYSCYICICVYLYVYICT